MLFNNQVYPQVTVDEDGEMKLDPDLFELYVNRLAIRFGYFKPPKAGKKLKYFDHSRSVLVFWYIIDVS